MTADRETAGRAPRRALIVTMPDGSEWAVPVDVVARDRASYYSDEFGGDVERSLSEDTLPLFESDPFEVEDWASNNMNWEDVAEHAVCLTPPEQVDMQEGWVNGTKRIGERVFPSPEAKP